MQQMGQPCGPMRVWQPYNDIPGLAMSRSIGDQAVKQFGVIAAPTFKRLKLQKGKSWLVVASDGIWDFISYQDIQNRIFQDSTQPNLSNLVQSITEQAKNCWLAKEALSDDITIILV